MTATTHPPRTALVTGATRGLGRALALDLARRGLRVFATGRSTAGLDALAAAAAAEDLAVVTLAADHTVAPDNARVVAAIAESGGLDVLIHNAGTLGPRLTLAEYPQSEWDRVLAVNLTAPFALTQALLPLLRTGASVQFVSSGVGNIGKARWGAYTVSKFGIESLGQTLADELRGHGIRVNVIDPGSMRTAMRAAAYPDEDPLTLRTPEDNTACFLWLALEAGHDVTGERFRSQRWTHPE